MIRTMHEARAARRPPPAGVRGGPLWLVGLHRVRAWLADFPAPVAAAAEAALAAERLTWVVEPDDELAQFRMTAAAGVDAVIDTLDHAARVLGREARVVWCLENRDNRGLDDFEAEFLFGQRLAIDALGQVERGAARSRLVVVGRPRVESLGLAFRVGPTDGRGTSCLAALKLQGVPLAAVLLDSDQARRLLAAPRSLFGQRLRGLAQERLIALGLHVPEHRAAAALADPAGELGPVQELGGAPARFVCFAGADPLDLPARFLAALGPTSLRGDISLEAPPDRATDGHLLHGPYYAAGAYQPMPFDLRLPTGLWRAGGWLEVPRVSLDQFGGDWQRLARWRTEPDRALLARLLDFRRMERYYQDWDGALRLRQTYHEYRVYNRGRPEFSPRCTLVDCGPLDDPQRLIALLRGLRRLTRPSQGSWQVRPAAAFLDDARSQARSRSPASRQEAVREQMVAHQYLGHIAVDGPLRQDVRDFIDWLPESLGTALELGSGYGQLARALAGGGRSGTSASTSTGACSLRCRTTCGATPRSPTSTRCRSPTGPSTACWPTTCWSTPTIRCAACARCGECSGLEAGCSR
jgi:hypothetical protein